MPQITIGTWALDSLDWFSLFLAALSIVIWIVAGWVRIYRLIRYFQLEGYDTRRYWHWLSNQRSERYFALANFLVMMLIVFFSEWQWSRRPFQIAMRWPGGFGTFVDVDSPFRWVIAPALLSGLAGCAFLIFRPRDRQVKQQFTFTSRALRLLGTALVVTAIPSIVLIGWLVANTILFRYPIWCDHCLHPEPSVYYGGNLVFILAWIAITGPASLLIAPLTLPLANTLMWPVEETFRRYYLSLAKRNLKRCGATVIAITGSYGKTSTKHYLSHILEARYRVLMTPKSYNTLLGISRVINEILAGDNSYDYFLVEAGAYIPGEIARICQLVEPKISMVTAVGPMHLERFGSIDNVVKAKYEIVEALPPDGICVFNGDDPRVRGMAERGYPQNRVLVTREGQAGARLAAEGIRMTADGLDFDVRDSQTGEKVSIHTPLYGEHNVTNILMAAGVAVYLGLSLKEIAMRAATLEPAEHRLHRRLMPDGTIVIDDAYSANPVGTQAALAVLALQPSGRKIVISSGMFELGPIGDEENRKLGERIAAVATDVILIGPTQVEPVRRGLLGKGFPADRLHVVTTLNEAVGIYRGILKSGDALLVLTDLPDTYA